MSDIRQDQERRRPAGILRSDTQDQRVRDPDTVDNQQERDPNASRDPQHPDAIEPSKRVRTALDKAAKLRDDLEPLAEKHSFVIGHPTHFGLGFDVFDPNSGLVMTAVRPHRSDVGEEAILLSASAVVQAIVAARRHQAAVA
jgi:hypothetical protein